LSVHDSYFLKIAQAIICYLLAIFEKNLILCHYFDFQKVKVTFYL
jgi:hypothetical protein